ncbi:MAG TPA: zinc dependent phospholipase C family protein [Candidatus Borkfalkia faecipullorum]|uniref:Zinc dependent phospholipase C family protein n=1 Tax=Candidatus Borkfalkia faecipullorum TaxID=2838510 RepID=A0A9D1V8F5_9FIRM|nr:zinc dependent phospholipase C family protein [Candidatus Borkfalkia faecipullorum]
MPAEYTHQLIAEQIYAGLPEGVRSEITDLSAFYLGAQGADVFYFVNYSKKPNIGKYLHNRRAYEFFTALLGEAKGGTAFSYAAGYLTHYAADTVFHPFVYAMTQQFMREFPDKKVRWHGYIESDLDTLFVREYAKVPVQEYRCPVREQNFDLHEISDLMRRVCAKFPVPRFTEEEFGRGVRRYFRFEKMLTDKRFRRRKVIFRMEQILHLPKVLSCLFRREETDARLKEVTSWKNPSAPEPCEEGPEQLFSRAVAEGIRLICLFFECGKKGIPLPFAPFNKGHLSGIDCRLPFVRPS